METITERSRLAVSIERGFLEEIPGLQREVVLSATTGREISMVSYNAVIN